MAGINILLIPYGIGSRNKQDHRDVQRRYRTTEHLGQGEYRNGRRRQVRLQTDRGADKRMSIYTEARDGHLYTLIDR